MLLSPFILLNNSPSSLQRGDTYFFFPLDGDRFRAADARTPKSALVFGIDPAVTDVDRFRHLLMRTQESSELPARLISGILRVERRAVGDLQDE